MIRHAGLVAARLGGFWKGVLIEGPSGSGKSDLALRALAAGFRLVADDRVELWVSAGRVFGRSPEALAGLMEARGVGILSLTPRPLAEVALVARCAVRPERLPEPQATEILGLALPVVEIAASEASAPAKLSRALTLFDGHVNRRM